MEDFKPTKKILITTMFMLAIIFIAQLLGEQITLARNNSVYSYISSVDPDRMRDSVKALEQSTKDLSGEHKSKIQAIYYNYLGLKWLILVALSYVAACLLFKRLKAIE